VAAVEPQQERSDDERWRDEPPLPQLLLAPDRAWREDVALEMWVEVTADVVVIRLEGVLDGSTGANLTEVVRGCQAEGRWDFVLDTGGLRMDRGGWVALNRLREQICAAGGRLRWDAGVLA
jgi:hypothetical protein